MSSLQKYDNTDQVTLMAELILQEPNLSNNRFIEHLRNSDEQKFRNAEEILVSRNQKQGLNFQVRPKLLNKNTEIERKELPEFQNYPEKHQECSLSEASPSEEFNTTNQFQNPQMQQFSSSAPNFYANSPYSSSSYSGSQSSTSTPLVGNFLSPYGCGLSPTFEFNIGMINWNGVTVASQLPTWPVTTTDFDSPSLSPSQLDNRGSTLTNYSPLATHCASEYNGHIVPKTATAALSALPQNNQILRPKCEGTGTRTNCIAMTRNSSSNVASNSNGHIMSTRRGGRKPRDFEDDLTEEDRDKRAKRRLRNKEAAARCRKRRIDQLTELQTKVDELKAENQLKEQLISQLLQQRKFMIQYLQQNNCSLPKDVYNFDEAICRSYAIAATANPPIASISFTLVQPDAMSNQESLNDRTNSISDSSSSNINNDMSFMDDFKNEYNEETSPNPSAKKSPNSPMLTDEDPLIAKAALELTSANKGLSKSNSLHDRPNSLQLNTLTLDSSLNITTPSTGLFTPGTSLFASNYDLSQRTFFTPIVDGPMLVQVTTSTPTLHTQNNDLRNL